MQLAAVEFLKQHKGRGPLFAGKRTGKSGATILWEEENQYDRVLNICLDSFADVWRMEHQEWGIDRLPLYRLTHGNRLQRAQFIKRLKGQPGKIQLNYESFWAEPIRSAIRDYFKPQLIEYDEASEINHRTSKQSKFAGLIATDPYVESIVPLTATPTDGKHEQYWPIYRACDPTVFGTRYEDFAYEYTVTATHICRGCSRLVNQFATTLRRGITCEADLHTGPLTPIRGSQVIGYRNVDKLRNIIKATSFEFSQEEANIPEPEDIIVPVTLSQRTRKAYDEFMKEYVAQFQSELTGDNLGVVARIALTAMLREAEITGGFVRDGMGGYIEVGSEKLDAALEIIRHENRDGHRVAVYCRFRPEVERLARELNIPLSQTYSGFATQEQREEALANLRRGNLPALICNIEVVRYGLDLRCCHSAIFYSTGYKLDVFDQAYGRLQGTGLTPLHFHLLCLGLADHKVYEALARKKSVAAEIHELEFVKRLRRPVGKSGVIDATQLSAASW